MHFTLCDYLLDLAQNSLEAKATQVDVELREGEETILFTIKDNGVGMTEEVLAKALDPFYSDPEKHSARKAGFGLPFIVQATELCEGSFSIESQSGVGTTVSYSFSLKSVDTPPMGNLATTMVSLFSMGGEYELNFTRVHTNGEYEVSRSDLLDALGELETVSSLKLAKEYLNSQEETLSIGD